MNTPDDIPQWAIEAAKTVQNDPGCTLNEHALLIVEAHAKHAPQPISPTEPQIFPLKQSDGSPQEVRRDERDDANGNPAAWQQLYEAGHAPPSGKISEGIALLRAENAELRAKASALCEQPLGFATATGPHVLVEQEPPVPESFVQGMQELAAQKAFDDLRAENAELRKDRERMDWVEKPTEGGDK